MKKMPIPYMVWKGNAYRMQRRIPADLLPHYPENRTGFIARYLGRDHETAKRKLGVYLGELEAEWTAIRKGGGNAVELSDKEIERLTAIWLHNLLDEDEQIRMEGLGSEELYASVTRMLVAHGAVTQLNFMPKPVPFGLSEREYVKLSENIEFAKAYYGDALAKGRIEAVDEELDDLLRSEGIAISKTSSSYRKLAYSVLKASAKAAEIAGRRHNGEAAAQVTSRRWPQASKL